MGSHFIGQAGSELLSSSDPTASASPVSGTTGLLSHPALKAYIKIRILYLILALLFMIS
jgi:hypothetical protein